MEKIQAYVAHREHAVHPVQILKPFDLRTRSKLCLDAIENEISGLLERGAFKYVNKEKLPKKTQIY